MASEQPLANTGAAWLSAPAAAILHAERLTIAITGSRKHIQTCPQEPDVDRDRMTGFHF
jgi:hypothetical protein